MSLGYAYEKLQNTVVSLAGERGTIMERFDRAIGEGLPAVHDNDVPDDLLGDLQSVKEGLRKVMADNINEQEASELAEKIVLLYGEVAKRVSRAG